MTVHSSCLCHNKVLQTEWLRTIDFTVSQFWRPGVCSPSVSRGSLWSFREGGPPSVPLSQLLVASGAPWLADAFLQPLPAPHMAFSLCVFTSPPSMHISVQMAPFCEDMNYVELGTTLWLHLNLTRSALTLFRMWEHPVVLRSGLAHTFSGEHNSTPNGVKLETGHLSGKWGQCTVRKESGILGSTLSLCAFTSRSHSAVTVPDGRCPSPALFCGGRESLAPSHSGWKPRMGAEGLKKWAGEVGGSWAFIWRRAVHEASVAGFSGLLMALLGARVSWEVRA